MSKQLTIATAALAVVAVSSVDAQWSANAGLSGSGGRPSYNAGVGYGGSSGWSGNAGVSGQFGGRPSYNAGVTYTSPKPTGWNFNAGVQGGAGARPSGGFTLSRKFEEDEEEEYDEQRIGLPNPFSGSTGPYNPIPPIRSFDEEYDEQGLSLKKIKKAVKKVGKTAGKIANGVEKAQALGVLEEEEWEVNAGIQGGGGRRRPAWNVGVSHKWENENELQDFKADLLKAAKVIVEANEMGIFDEDAVVEEGLKKVVKKAVKVAVVAHEAGLLEDVLEEEEQSIKKIVKKAVKVAVVANEAGLLEEFAPQRPTILPYYPRGGVFEEEEGWEVGGGISGSGGDISWNVGIKGSWEEEHDEQGLSLKKVKKAINKVGKTAGKIANGVEKAQQIGVLEEEEWEMNAGISGSGGKPTWNVGISHKWEEEEEVLEEQPGFLAKLSPFQWFKPGNQTHFRPMPVRAFRPRPHHNATAVPHPHRPHHNATATPVQRRMGGKFKRSKQ